MKLGLMESTVFQEVDKIIDVMRLSHFEIESYESANDTSKSLRDAGYISGHLNDRLVAELLIEWTKIDTAQKEGKLKDEKALTESQEVSDDSLTVNSGIPKQIMEVEEGYPRMALVMAFRLHSRRGLDEQLSKDLARAMVGVWITYGFTYREIYDICCGTDTPEIVTFKLMDMLNKKLFQGYAKPMSFGFGKLIKLTQFYFDQAV